MSVFSEQLDSYMEENAINSAELAREMDLERTLVYRYRKGSRVPSDEQVVNRMADALRMNVHEKKILLEKYDRVTLGEMTVNSYQYVENLLERMKNTERKTSVAATKLVRSWMTDFPESILHMESEEEIIACVSNLFGEISEKKEEALCIRLVMQPVYDSVQKLLQNFFCNTHVHIEQVICLEQSLSKSYMNLEIFQQVLPLCFDRISYEVRYYYDFLTHHINFMSWMPNIMLVGDYVLQFDYDMKHGILVKNEQYKQGMEAEFLKLRSRSLPFLVSGTDMMYAMQFYETTKLLGHGGTLFVQPCFGYCISTDIYEKFLVPIAEKDMMIEKMAEVNGDWDGMKFLPPSSDITKSLVSYCQESGIRRFMETGRVDEFPAGFYEPLDREARHLILNRLIWMLKRKYMDCCFLPEEIKIPERIHFYLDDDRKRISLNSVAEGSISQVYVEEQGIYRAFKYFFEYLEKKGLLLGSEKVLERLEVIRREYK